MAVRVSRTAPAYVLALVQSEGGKDWRDAIVASLEALRALLPTKLMELPPPAVSPSAWEASWKAAPGSWFQIFELAERTAAKAPTAALRVLWTVPAFQCYRSIMEEDPDEYLRGLCPATFTTAGGATTHRIKVHLAVASQPARLRAAVVGSCLHDGFSPLAVGPPPPSATSWC